MAHRKIALTTAQRAALENIKKYERLYHKEFNHEAAKKTIFSVRYDILERLYDAGLIVSARPFNRMFHRVSVSDRGNDALAKK